MSKLNIKLSYKNACILKHALRNQTEFWEKQLTAIKGFRELDNEECEKELIKMGFTEEFYQKKLKEHEEEKRALAAITEEIERYSIRFPRRSK
ncbi:MAG: hypothetical protein ACLSBN_05520 [Clostridium perfringens]